MNGRPVVIDVDGLTRRFGDFVAVDRVSFQVFKGEIFGYLGANGAGKSTTIRMLCGLLLPSSGRASVAGVDVNTDPEEVKRVIGYMSQKFSLYADLSAEENLDFFGGAYGMGGKRLRQRSQEVLTAVNLWEQRKSIVADLPGGWRQRLALACSILHGPHILFLDEPTAGVDPLSRRIFWDLVRNLARNGTTILVTTHYMDEAEYCDRVGLMADGKLAALDAPEGLKSTHVPGQMYDVRQVPSHALPYLEKLPNVLQAEPFGAGFHVRFKSGSMTVPSLMTGLHGAGFAEAVVEELEATLEDVFLEVVRKAAGSQAAPVAS